MASEQSSDRRKAEHSGREEAGNKMSDQLLDELDATVVALGRMFAMRHGEMCERAPLSGPRLMMLRMLSETGSLKAGDLAGLLGIKAPATSSLLDALERDGLVAREHGAQDRRVTLVSITDSGRRVLSEAEEVRRAHMRRYRAVLNEDDVRTLIRIHKTILEAMRLDAI